MRSIKNYILFIRISHSAIAVRLLILFICHGQNAVFRRVNVTRFDIAQIESKHAKIDLILNEI